MVLVDFSLAFNCVNHRLLETKLDREFGFSAGARELISSFLRGRSQTVRINATSSTVQPLSDGTPQGSCLSALLFSMFINSLPSVLNCRWQLYADDLQIYTSGPADSVDRLINEINTNLQTITEWSKRNFLAPNPKKTQSIIFCKTGTVTPQTDILFSGEIVPLSDCVTNLGLQLDHHLSWTNQVNDVVKKVYATLRTFHRFAAVLSAETRRRLVQAVIMPFFTYCDVVYHPGLSAAQREQLHRGFKSAVRFVYRLKRRDSTATVRNTIIGHDLPANYVVRKLLFMKQAFDGTLPGYLMQHFQRSRQERSRNFNLVHQSTSSRKSLLNHGASSWNTLPAAIKGEQITSRFKLFVRDFASEQR